MARKRYVDVKEAPLEINNALKDESKRKIIRTLRKEKKYLSVIAEDIGEHVAKTKYHLADLERFGIVTTMKLTREKFFLLTKLGRECLIAIDVYYPENFFRYVVGKLKKPVRVIFKRKHERLLYLF